jgi:hypothetical protein
MLELCVSPGCSQGSQGIPCFWVHALCSRFHALCSVLCAPCLPVLSGFCPMLRSHAMSHASLLPLLHAPGPRFLCSVFQVCAPSACVPVPGPASCALCSVLCALLLQALNSLAISAPQFLCRLFCSFCSVLCAEDHAQSLTVACSVRHAQSPGERPGWLLPGGQKDSGTRASEN